MAAEVDRIKRTAELLNALPSESREPLLALVEQLAGAAGVTIEKSNGYIRPVEGIEAWVTKLRSERRSERTIEMYSYLAEQVLTEMPEPTRQDIQRYLSGKMEQGLSPAAAENKRKALSSLFRFLYEERLIPNNPMDGVRAIRVTYAEKKPPTLEDIGKVLEVGCMRARDTDKIRTIIVLLSTTGLRLTEAASLRKDCIDLKAMELTIVGKGSKRRVVPLVKPTADALMKYMEDHMTDSPYVFPGDTRTGYAEIYNIEKTMRRACIRAGVRPFTPHQLRHLYATEMLKGGAKLEVVGRILGHSSIGITADIYRHVRTEEMHEAVERYGPQNGMGKQDRASEDNRLDVRL